MERDQEKLSIITSVRIKRVFHCNKLIMAYFQAISKDICNLNEYIIHNACKTKQSKNKDETIKRFELKS